MQNDFVKPLIIWYNAAKRDLPWRHTKDPYRIWVSEIMLQQTRVEAVKAYYERFVAALPDAAALAACPDDRLMKLWEGLGYYSRVRNMKKAAQMITDSFGGQFPAERKELLSLPGIGSYTAGAVASIAFGKREAAVDGNVLRVYARMTALRENVLLPEVKKMAEEDLGDVVRSLPESSDDELPGSFTQALIELGALVCVPNAAPHCEECPVSGYCKARAAGIQEELPVRLRKTKRRAEQLTVLLIRDGEETAVRKRLDRGFLAGLYEFPHLPGHVSAEEAVSFVEENGFEALRVTQLQNARHLFSHVEWDMTGYEIRIAPRGEIPGGWLFAGREDLLGRLAVPSAFSAYLRLIRDNGQDPKYKRKRTGPAAS